MHALLMIALALVGLSMPTDVDEFYVGGTGGNTMVLSRIEPDVWRAQIIDRQAQAYIPAGDYHLNGLAIGHKNDSDYRYQDLTELLPIETLSDLIDQKKFKVNGGQVYVHRDDQQITINYAPSALTDRELSLSVRWRKPETSSP